MKALIIVTVVAATVAALPIGCTQQKANEQAATSPAAAHVITLDELSFDAQVQSGVVLVDFWATWCGPCKIQGPIVQQVADQMGGKVKIGKLDVDAAPKIAQKYNIRSIPTLVVFKDGKPTTQFVGVTKADKLVAAINSALNSK
jgi:thioredoxin 1